MIEILYEDKSILVCVKPAGFLSEDNEDEKSLPRAIKEQYAAHSKRTELFTLHRLDREVFGVMVFAKTRRAAAVMSERIASAQMEKIYLAVVHGAPKLSEARLVDLLFKDSSKNKTYVVDRMRRGVREAILNYTTLGTKNGTSLLEVKLETGRSHQIRAQLSHLGHPILGDRKYGSNLRLDGVALLSHKLSFSHPDTNEKMSFSYLPPDTEPWGEYQTELKIKK